MFGVCKLLSVKKSKISKSFVDVMQYTKITKILKIN